MKLRLALAAIAILSTSGAQAAPAPARNVGPVGVAPPIQADARSQQIIQQRAAIAARVTPVTDAMLLNPPAEDWLNWRRTYDAHGFSPLTQINTRNVGNMRSAWAWSLSPGTNQVTPLVHDGVMYVNSAGDNVQALDATNGELLWWYDRPETATATGGAQVHRNIALGGDKVFLATDDKHVIALDAKTGKVVWDHGFPDGNTFRMTAGPIVVKGKVIQPTTTCTAGGCPIIALDAATGAEAWRFYTVAKAGQPGGETWNGLPDDQRFGASIWVGGSYEPALNLVYFGTGNTYHWQELFKGGPNKPPGSNKDGLYVNTTLALNPDTGKLVWHYQHMHEEPWDLDWAFERMVVTRQVNGRSRRMVCTTGKIVFTDCVDAATGEFILAHDAGLQNIIKSYDPKTGRKTYFPEAIPDLTGQRRNLQCSAGYGAKNWPSGSYNAALGVNYTSLVEVCGESAPIIYGDIQGPFPGNSQEIRIARYQPGSDGNIGRLDAVDWVSGKTLWSYRQRASMTSAVVATAGGVIFAGDSDRYFMAFDQASGKVLWKTRLNNQINAFPITYAVRGKQYVAIVTGCCGNGRINNMRQLTPEIQPPRGSEADLWVFEVPTP